MTQRVSLTCSLLFALALLLPHTSQAQVYADQVWQQLQGHYTVISNQGNYGLQNTIMGRINDDGSDSWTFPFESGNSYIITAACDNDCSDIDVSVNDSSGNVVAQDTENDDTPVVSFSPKSSGRYTVEVKMYECSSNPCYFGFSIYAQ